MNQNRGYLFWTFGLLTLLAPLALAPIATAAEQAPTTRPAKAVPDRATLEKRLADTLTDATLVGKYTIEGSDAAPKEDRYRITKAVKGAGDDWEITSSIEYRGFGIPVTLTLPIRWAGDTAVLEVTDQKIPGIGVFTARVLFYGDHYIGVWSGSATHQGVMWGQIEHGAAPAPTTRPTEHSAGR